MSIQTIEQDVRKIISNTTVAQEDDIPFADYQEFLRMEKERRVRISSEYDGDLVSALGSKWEMLMHTVLLFSPLAIGVASVVLAFVLFNYWLLLGAVLALLGFLLSTPVFMKRFGSMILIGVFICFAYSCYQARWVEAILWGSYAFSNFFILVAREQCRMIIHRTILESEPIFVWLYGNRKIMVAKK